MREPRMPRSAEISEIEKETAMTLEQKVTVSMQPMARRPSSAERRAAHIATVSTEQAELQQEAAERSAAPAAP
jgi:hypothetical protein